MPEPEKCSDIWLSELAEQLRSERDAGAPLSPRHSQFVNSSENLVTLVEVRESLARFGGH